MAPLRHLPCLEKSRDQQLDAQNQWPDGERFHPGRKDRQALQTLTPRHLTKSHNPLETAHSCYCPFSFTPSVPSTIVAFPPVCPTVPQFRGFGVRSVEVCDVA
jgi:hypothetical protein